jgi:hypothetical protein
MPDFEALRRTSFPARLSERQDDDFDAGTVFTLSQYIVHSTIERQKRFQRNKRYEQGGNYRLQGFF